MKRAANATQKSEWLPAAIGGELQATLAFTEPQAGYDSESQRCRQRRRRRRSWQLNGSKGYVLNGGNAELIIVRRRTSGERTDTHGITLFGVPATARGMTIRDYATVDGLRAAEISLEDVNVDQSQVIGKIDSGFEALNQPLRMQRWPFAPKPSAS